VGEQGKAKEEGAPSLGIKFKANKQRQGKGCIQTRRGTNPKEGASPKEL
jgi:hypothetical protein